ncbi:GAF and ANTAR domain-containing protein [Streptodolium elevatio]|uniref:GAF and ANTAR domain-containing protein n=1 Tax=Streptodolium elevatio TaxID=3157996 RepID=A0ABV3DNI8_9ACTN
MNAVGRSARIRILVAEHAARRRARVGVLDVCTAAVATLPVQGAGVSAMSPTTAGHPLCSTDDISEQLEELQLTFGEGPCVDAFAQGTAVLAADLRAGDALDRWPAFAPAATQAGAGAVFAFPLRVDAASPGVLDLYAHRSGDLDLEQLADAIVFADTAALVLLGTPLAGPGAPVEPEDDETPDAYPVDLGGYRAEIDQATGMLTEQLGVGIDEAYIRLRAHAYAHERRLADVARDVVARTLRFTPEPTGNRETTHDDT